MKFSFLAQEDEHFTKESALKSRDHLMNIYSTSKSNSTVNKNHQEADFSVEKLPKLSRSSAKKGRDTHRVQNEVITETDETKPSTDESNIKEFNQRSNERRFSYLEDSFLIPEEENENDQ